MKKGRKERSQKPRGDTWSHPGCQPATRTALPFSPEPAGGSRSPRTLESAHRGLWGAEQCRGHMPTFPESVMAPFRFSKARDSIRV